MRADQPWNKLPQSELPKANGIADNKVWSNNFCLLWLACTHAKHSSGVQLTHSSSWTRMRMFLSITYKILYGTIEIPIITLQWKLLTIFTFVLCQCMIVCAVNSTGRAKSINTIVDQNAHSHVIVCFTSLKIILCCFIDIVQSRMYYFSSQHVA